MSRWAVLGAGSWGTALALVLARTGNQVLLWDHQPTRVEVLRRDGENRRYLPGIALPPAIEPTADLSSALTAAEHVLLVVPSHAFRSMLEQLRPYWRDGRPLVWATKGLDAASGGFLHHVAAEILPDAGPVAVLSGPSFAAEVARGLPTAVVVASADERFAASVAADFHGESFRVYTSHDIVGVELGGSVKNVLAIATGISDGLGFGANARAALVTRGLAELVRLGQALQADPRTLMGLSGVGDLILTCTDDQSRNRRLGLALGRGRSLREAQQDVGQTVEGVRTAAEVLALARHAGVDAPICEHVYRVLAGELSAHEAMRLLMQRAQKSEFDG
jgi:glycerol-3-phosphate dehydrogenase (NAD(P)+)